MKNALTSNTNLLDKVGVASSGLCAVHCAVMPLVIMLLPFVGFSFFASETMEWLLFGASALVGVSSICWGLRKHKNRSVLSFLGTGLALIAIGRLGDMRHWPTLSYVAFLVAGGCVVAASHWINHSLCSACTSCEHHRTDEPEDVSVSDVLGIIFGLMLLASVLSFGGGNERKR